MLLLEGLKVQYGENKALKEWIRMRFTMALVPIQRVDELYLYLIDNSEDLLDEFPQLQLYLDYLTTIYVDDDALFSVHVWNQYRPEGPRTNNHVEGYNSKLNKFIAKHPNIWEFIEKIQSEETNTRCNYTKIEHNNKLKNRGRDKIALATDLAISKANCEFLTDDDLIEFSLKLINVVPDFE